MSAPTDRASTTITPYYGYPYHQLYPDLTRQQINDWILTAKVFDGVFDFDAAIRDPTILRRSSRA